jgi:hypothetical protein
MILRLDRLQVELPPPSDPDPAGAAAVQELLGGKFGTRDRGEAPRAGGPAEGADGRGVAGVDRSLRDAQGEDDVENLTNAGRGAPQLVE